jgi:hypothetical protein
LEKKDHTLQQFTAILRRTHIDFPNQPTNQPANQFRQFTASTMSGNNKEFEGDAGAPLPDFSGARNISLTTVAPALGVKSQGAQQPDYLDFDQKGRGTIVTMFANSGMCYLTGIGGGGLYGLQKGISSTNSSKFKVQLNAVLNNAGRYGSRAGNTMGVFAVMYSLYEGLGDNVSNFLLFFNCIFYENGCVLAAELSINRLVNR